jgi:uncharacterized protein (TIGR03435 family)
MTDRVVRKLHFTSQLLLRVAGWLTVAAVALFVLVAAAQSRAQSPTDNKTQSIADTWQGTLHPGRDLRIVVKITKADANMGDFTGLMQQAVLDRPVLDQTGITGRYDFTLVWTPDDSRFAGMGVKIPPPAAEDGKAPPNLYTAIQEQIGLKMAPAKFPDDVIVIDHVEKPSEN